MTLIREKQLQFSLIVIDFMQLAKEIQRKMSSYIWIFPLHNCSCCNYRVSTPIKWMLRVLQWLCVGDGHFQMLLLAKSDRWGAAKGAWLWASSTWAPPSQANKNIQPRQKGKGVLTVIQALSFSICFCKNILNFLFGRFCLVLFNLCWAL